ncbi:MAG TPA: hypothetical protein P5186_00640 [Candidatus Paceibacterota bacterium]|nr:hypothetical protein [Verrucomicrobiota bacterium]HRY46528.1 hypothetical protein [Candidatus Paceibacterota bacterium]HRZ99265.1 hypothetical protein [Candidatus Paceibacterota bacterium]
MLRNESSSPIKIQNNPATNLTGYFVGSASGNLRLKGPLPELLASAILVEGVVEDIDRQPRTRPAPGADEWKEALRFENVVVDAPVEMVMHSLAARDMNGDGQTDIVTARMHQGAPSQEVSIYLDTGGGTAGER